MPHRWCYFTTTVTVPLDPFQPVLIDVFVSLQGEPNVSSHCVFFLPAGVILLL